MADNTVKTVFTADASGAKVGANEAAVAVEKSAEKQAKAVDKVPESIKQIPKANAEAALSWDKQIGKVTAFVGKMGAAIGVATGFYRIGVSIREAWDNVFHSVERAADRAEQFAQSLDFGNAEASLKNIDKAIADVQTRAAGRQEQNPVSQLFGALRGETAASFAEEAGRLESIRTSLVQKAADDRAKAEAEAAKKAADDRKKQEEESAKDSLDRAKSLREQAAQIEAGTITDAEARLKAIARLEQQANDERAKNAKTAEERDAVFALGRAQFAKYQADLTELHEQGEKERREATEASVRAMVAEYEALAGAIQNASQAQQSFSQNQFGGMVSDIKKIAQLLEVRGGWKK